MLRTIGRCGDKRQVNFSFQHRRQFDLGLFSRFFQTLQGHLVLSQIDAVFLLEFVSHPVDDLLVEVIAAQVVVPSCRLNFEDAVAEFEDGDIEGAAAQVEDHDLLGFALFKAIGQRCGGRFVDNSLNVEACDTACVLCRLTLCVVEVRRHGDDGFFHFFAEVSFRVSLQFLQDDR